MNMNMNITNTIPFFVDDTYVQSNSLSFSILLNIILLINVLYAIFCKTYISNIFYDILHMNENDIEKVIVMLTSRAIIPNIYTKERVSDLVNFDITDNEWLYLIKNQHYLSSEYNLILKEWIKYVCNQNTNEDYSDSESSDDDKSDNIINKLETLPYTVLQKLACINNKSYKKTELVQFIIEKIKHS